VLALQPEVLGDLDVPAALVSGAARCQGTAGAAGSEARRSTVLIGTGWPAGQVMLRASRSMVKSWIVNPPGTADGVGQGLTSGMCPASVSVASASPVA
jgi:hypothetical protein